MARKKTTKSSYTGLWVVLGLAAVGTAAYFLFRKKPNADLPPIGPGSMPSNLPAPTPVPGSSVFPLRQGSSGKEVAALQRFLNYTDSNNKLIVDGRFGTLTKRAWDREQTGSQVVTQDYYNSFVKRFEQ
jgi:hypothetical protein